jgi:hypothetical protein
MAAILQYPAKLPGTLAVRAFRNSNKEMIVHLQNIAAIQGSRGLYTLNFTVFGKNRYNRFFFALASLSPWNGDDGHIGSDNSGILNEMRIRIIRLGVEDNNLESGDLVSPRPKFSHGFLVTAWVNISQISFQLFHCPPFGKHHPFGLKSEPDHRLRMIYQLPIYSGCILYLFLTNKEELCKSVICSMRNLC